MRTLLLVAAVLVLAPDLAAQRVRIEGGVEHPSAILAQQVVTREDYLLIDEDTVLPKSFRAPGDLVVIGADVRLEGRVAGAVAVLGGDLFIRPRAVVHGDIAAVGGSVYPSGLARTGEILELPIGTDVSVRSSDKGYVVHIAPVEDPRASLELPGLFGLGQPTYNRVDGLTVRAGLEARPFGGDGSPVLTAWVSYYSARGAIGGGAAFTAPLTEEVHLRASAARRTATNEEWIRGDLLNSLSSLFLRNDVRNYWQTEAVSLSLVRERAEPLIAGEHFLGGYIRARASRDESLPASEPWSVFGDEWRPNPPIADGTLASLIAGSTLEWVGASTSGRGEIALEWAPAGWGDFEFARWVAEGRWEMRALKEHKITLYARGLGPLTGGVVPPQRWSFVGGSGTLPTLELGTLRGDHLVFVESRYAMSVPWLRLPVAGSPSFVVRHAVGSAWVGDDAPAWSQSLGAGVQVRVAEVLVHVDPAHGLDPVLTLGVALPAF